MTKCGDRARSSLSFVIDIELETLPVPSDDGLRFDNDQDLPPILTELGEALRRIDPADAVAAGEFTG
jgi:hypothetical protein